LTEGNIVPDRARSANESKHLNEASRSSGTPSLVLGEVPSHEAFPRDSQGILSGATACVQVRKNISTWREDYRGDPRDWNPKEFT
jgi:hypothetical protein